MLVVTESEGGTFMDRFLLILGFIVFAGSLITLVMNFIGEYEGTTLIASVLGILNASIAIAVSEILSTVKKKEIVTSE